MNDDIVSSDPGEPGSSSDPEALNPDPASADTTAQLGTQDGDPGGALPLDRHKEILENTRRDYEERYGWTHGLDRHRVERALDLADAIEHDTERVYHQLAQRLGKSGRPAADLGPDLRDERTQQPYYSPERVAELLDAKVREALSTVEQRIAPVESELSGYREAASAADLASQARQWPHFGEHESDIVQEIKRLASLPGGRELSRSEILNDAYRNVVLPKLETTLRDRILNGEQTRPGRTIRPGGSPRDTRPDHEKSWTDLFREEEASRA